METSAKPISITTRKSSKNGNFSKNPCLVTGKKLRKEKGVKCTLGKDVGVEKERKLCLEMADVLQIRESEGSTGVASACAILEILMKK